MASTAATRVALAVGLVAGLFASCVNTAPMVAAGLADACVLNTDCESPLVCAFRRCHTQCTDDRDCARPSRCVPADRPFNVCLLPQDVPDAGCDYNSQCPEGLTCGRDHVCRYQCMATNDCVPGQVCVERGCAFVDEAADGGLTVPPGSLPPSAACRYHSECQAPLVCLSGACSPQCLTSRDCAIGFSCAGGQCVATLPDGGMATACVLSSECPLPLVCRQGACVAECAADRDCARGFSCAQGRCAPLLPGSPDASVPSGYGAPCSLTGQCAPQLECRAGACVYECVDARDCNTSLTECCLANRCARGPVCTAGTVDGGVYDAGTPADAGARCLNSAQCDDGQFCNGAETCVRGNCVPAARTVCDDENPCTQDLCSETGRTCAYNPLGPQDVDQDGHFDQACGQGADDCDDGNPNVYRGALERCDLVDNNCNGQVDENVWAQSPGSLQVLQNTPAYGITAGPPAVLQSPGKVELIAPADRAGGTFDYLTVDPTSLTLSSSSRPLFGSRTLWETCQGSYGKRVFIPRIFVSPTERLVSGVSAQVSGPANGCCSPGELWRLRVDAKVYDATITSPSLEWTLDWPGNQMDIYPGCPGNDPAVTQVYGNNGTGLAAAWVPQRQAWQFVHSDRTMGLFVERLGADAGTTVKPLMTAPWAAALAGTGPTPVFMASVAGGVLVVWEQQGTVQVSTPYVVAALFDPDLNAPLWGPLVLNARQAALRNVWAEGTDVLVAIFGTFWTGPGFSNGLELLRLDPTTGTVRQRNALTTTLPGANGLTSATFPQVQPLNGGLGVAYYQGDTLTYGWGRTDLDGGLTWIDVPLGPGPRGPPALVAMDPKRVGVVWAQSSAGGSGPLTRTVLECGP